MADRVQEVMEDMVPMLNELIEREIFTKDEVQSVIRKRREFEYRIVRRDSLKADYIEYIKYEIGFETLRRHRVESQKIKKQGLSEYAGMRHIHNLYNRACVRFREDMQLWYEHINFCLKSGGQKILQRTIAKALDFHPREAALWLIAADRELQSGHVSAARTLLLRGVRMSPKDWRMWTELIKFEALVATRMARANHVRSQILTQEKDLGDIQDEFAVTNQQQGEVKVVNVRALATIIRHMKRTLAPRHLPLALAATYLTAARLKLTAPAGGLNGLVEFFSELESGLIEVAKAGEKGGDATCAALLWRDLLMGSVDSRWSVFGDSNAPTDAATRAEKRTSALQMVLSDAVMDHKKMIMLSGALCSAVAPLLSNEEAAFKAKVDEADDDALFSIDGAQEAEALVKQGKGSAQDEEDTLEDEREIDVWKGSSVAELVALLASPVAGFEALQFSAEWRRAAGEVGRMATLGAHEASTSAKGSSNSAGIMQDALSVALFRPFLPSSEGLFDLQQHECDDLHERATDLVKAGRALGDVVVGEKALAMQRKVVRAVFPAQAWLQAIAQLLENVPATGPVKDLSVVPFAVVGHQSLGEGFETLVRASLHLSRQESVPIAEEVLDKLMRLLARAYEETKTVTGKQRQLTRRARLLVSMAVLVADLGTCLPGQHAAFVRDITLHALEAVREQGAAVEDVATSPEEVQQEFTAMRAASSSVTRLVCMLTSQTVALTPKQIRTAFATLAERRSLGYAASIERRADEDSDSEDDEDHMPLAKRQRIASIEVGSLPLPALLYDVAALVAHPETRGALTVAAKVSVSLLAADAASPFTTPAQASAFFKRYTDAMWLPALSPMQRRLAACSFLFAAAEHVATSVVTFLELPANKTNGKVDEILQRLGVAHAVFEALIAVATSNETAVLQSQNLRLAKSRNGSVQSLRADVSLIDAAFEVYCQLAKDVEKFNLPSAVFSKGGAPWGTRVKIEQRAARALGHSL